MPKKKRKKIQTTVYLAEDQLWQLQLFSVFTNTPVAALIRQGIAAILAKHKMEAKPK